MTVRVALIVAVAKNRVIGRDNRLPWKISADLKFFKATTMGKPIVMGRKTFQSLGKPLPGRTNIVVTRDQAYGPTGAVVVHDPFDALSVGAAAAKATGADEVMVIGGAELYAQMLPFAHRLYVTEVDLAPEGDAFFPPLDPAHWRETSRQAHPPEGDTPGFAFVTYERALNPA